MHGLTSTFKRLRHNLPLKDDDIKSLRRFIDEFTTISTVGKEVARVAKTCCKNDTTCRFC